MHCLRNLAPGVVWVGGNDRRLDLFENIHPVAAGMSYNSYLLLDDKTALLDTADVSVSQQFMENVVATLQGRPLDYLIINHMEPDHAALLADVIRRWPQVQLYGTAKAFQLLEQFFPEDYSDRCHPVGDGDTLSTGRHELHFVTAVMVHWPECMVTFEASVCILFSADVFFSCVSMPGCV